MVKGNIENSLKRFLKRRVKFTLGLMITFLITGTVTFSADKNPLKDSQSVKEYLLENKLNGILTAKNNLTGLGNGKIVVDENNQYIIIETTESEVMLKDKDEKTELIKIDKLLLSETIGQNISNFLEKMNGKTNEISSDGKISTNAGVLKTEQLASNTIFTLINNGIIKTTDNLKGQYYAAGREGMTFINNGIISSGHRGQVLYEGNDVKLENNGIILSGDTGQIITGQGIIINSGVIKNHASQGQEITSTHSQAINYGIIESASIGQRASGISGSVLINYGKIIASGNNANGQNISNSENKAINYGIINSFGNSAIGQSGIGIYNYGLIDSTVTGMSGKGYNYGVVKVSDASKAFSDDVTNKGIVIADNGELKTQYNTGILLDNNYNAIGKDVKTFETAGELVTDFAGKNTFGEENSKGFVKDITVNIDNVQNKFIGAVVTDNSKLENNSVFNYTRASENGLFLKSASIVGYFEKDGVLLNVGNNDLTLGGDTNITAVKGDLSLDVYAVNIGKENSITITDEAKINGIIKGGKEINFVNTKGNYTLVDGGIVNIEVKDSGNENLNYVDITLENGKELSNGKVENNVIQGLKLSTENTTEGLVNRVEIRQGLKVGNGVVGADGNKYSIYDDNTNPDTELELTVHSIHDLAGDVLLGAGKDTFIIKAQDAHGMTDPDHAGKIIDLGAGEDKFVAEGTAGDNIFGYNVKNAETVELKNGTWGNWDQAGKIEFTDYRAAGKVSGLTLGNGTTLKITLNKKGEYGSDFANYIGNTLSFEHAVITGAGEDKSFVKYVIDENGLDEANLNTNKYSFKDGTVTFQSAIFKVESDSENQETTVTVKTAEEMGLSAEDRIIYEAYLNEIKADGTIDEDAKKVIAQINSYNSSEEFANLIRNTSATGEAYYTAGSTLTKDITSTYVSAVEDFTKRAEKGQWLAQGKYINSDTEFDGGTSVKGYDGDITGTVGMIEYGVTENTSYGAVFGMGDAEMDIDGGGKLDGDNTYAGLYMKHRTANGIELVGNIGYMESDMDSVLRNDFNFSNSHNTEDGKYPVETGGKTFEKGTVDSSAVVIGLKGRKDYRISDTVKLQPTLGARLTFINQDEAENEEMHFTIAEQDIIVVEGTAGMGVAKEFALSQGKLELNAGAEYTFAATNSNNEAKFKVFDKEKPLEDTDAAENTGTVYVGADYEHENGVGFNGKYEMMWSDKGDDSRITAGMSYRF